MVTTDSATPYMVFQFYYGASGVEAATKKFGAAINAEDSDVSVIQAQSELLAEFDLVCLNSRCDTLWN